MPIHHAVLALLAEGPSHGYELKSRFEEAVGPSWGGLNIGHLYQILDRAERDGLVSKRHVAQSDRPDKSVYRITKKGRADLELWLGEPASRQGGYRDDFFLKLFAAARFGEKDVERVLSVQREMLLNELATLTSLISQPLPALTSLLVTAAVEQSRAQLAIVEVAEVSIAELVAQASGTPHSPSIVEQEAAWRVVGRRKTN